MSNATQRDRITTDLGSRFLRCVALPIREQPLGRAEMRGVEGGQRNDQMGRQSRVRAHDRGRSAASAIGAQNPLHSQLSQLEAAAAFGVISVGNVDSTRTSVRKEIREAPGRLVRTRIQYPVTPQGPPRSRRHLPRQELRRHPDHLGSTVRHIPSRDPPATLRTHHPDQLVESPRHSVLRAAETGTRTPSGS